MDVRYTPGPRFVVVGELAIAVLDPAVSAEVLETIWHTLVAGGGVGEVLQTMTGAYGTNLTAIPPFAVIAPAIDGVRLAVRGALVVRVRDRAGTQTVSGVGVTTWSERWMPDPVSIEILDADVAVSLSQDPLVCELPICSGVVKADSVGLVVRGALSDDAEVVGALASLASGPCPEMAGSVAFAPEMAFQAVPAPEIAFPETPAPEPFDPDVTFVDPGDPVTPEEPTVAPPARTPLPESGVQMSAPGIPTVEEPVSEGAEDSYDHLWGPTVLRRVEDAAIREAEDSDEAAPGAFAGGPLIADVPGSGAPGATPAEFSVGDHDGETIMGSQLAAIRAQAHGGPHPVSSPPGGLPPTGQTVLARVCGAGHPNPPQSTQCHLCGLDLLGEASRVSRPTLGRIVLSTGSVIELDRPVVVGRKPRVSRVQGADLPRLVTVPSPQQDISRSHLEVRIEEWHVLVVDLGTTNGTILQRPGQPHRRLHPNESVMVRSADVVDLGDGVTITFEEIP